jgi:hypothetical protein
MSTTSQISNPAFDYRHQGFSVKILELERDAYPPLVGPPRGTMFPNCGGEGRTPPRGILRKFPYVT